jgi:hypothetical protein
MPSLYLLICHYSVLTPPQTLLAPSGLFWILFHPFITVHMLPELNFIAIVQISFLLPLQAHNQVSAFLFDSLLVSCNSKLQHHSLSARQLPVYFLCRFDNSNTVFNQLISKPSCELAHLSFPTFNSSQFLF